MADQVHRLAHPLQPFDEPIDVLLFGGAEAARPGRAEAGQIPSLDVAPDQVSAHAVPHTVSVGDAVDQNCRHD